MPTSLRPHLVASLLLGPALAAAEPAEPVRYAIDLGVGHFELGSEHHTGLNELALHARAINRGGALDGVMVQADVAGFLVKDRAGLFTAATVGYGTGGRLWVRAGAGLAAVWYHRVDRLMGVTQSGSSFAPTNHRLGFAIDLGAGCDVWTSGTSRVYLGVVVDGMINPNLGLLQPAVVLGLSWR